ncbi:MAG: CDP-glycerol glycerophosphotransferase family protein [Propionicimonas sp.]|nr:CDP-glycerol glycerophosphotransferase family protein [Propionicimonas sp.]
MPAAEPGAGRVDRAPGLVDPADYDEHFQHQLAALAAPATAGAPADAVRSDVLSDLAGYFLLDRRDVSPTAALTPAEAGRLLDWAARIVAELDPALIERADGLTRDVRAALLGLRGPLPPPDSLAVRRVDRFRRLGQVRFFHDAGPADVEFLADGEPASPVFAKRRGVHFFGRAVVDEQIAWLPLDGRAWSVRVGGTTVAVRGPKARAGRSARGPARPGLRARLGRLRTAVTGWARRIPRNRSAWLVWWAAPSRGGRRYAGAWLVMDRDTEAHDNAEHLYRHLCARHRELNAWFVLDRAAPDWARLEREGFRLLAHGSRAHTIALLNCRHLVSSQVSGFITSPPNWPGIAGEPGWQFHFLQHGVAHDDLSRWFNSRPLDTLVCTTPQEYASFTEDGGNYVFTDREVLLSGLPRHDELLRKARSVAPDERRLIVFLPTWRRGLAVRSGSSNRLALRPGFWESRYASEWFGLVNSPTLAELASARGLERVVVPHPNLGPALAEPGRAPGVRVAGYHEIDIQDILARAAVVVTDYSSVAFDAALIDRPVLYFQFDRDTFFTGGSGRRPGYFETGRDGFGPVCVDRQDAERELALLLEAGPSLEPYAGRRAATFTLRDEDACERVVQAILERSGPPGHATPTAPGGTRD